jgi:signal transduction histidine kinase
MTMMRTMTVPGGPFARREVAFAVVLSLLGLLLMLESVSSHEEWWADPDRRAEVHVGNLLPYELVVPLFLLVTVPVLWRRVAPTAAIAASCVGLLLNYALTGTEVLRCGVVLLVGFLFAFTAGTRASWTGLALSVALIVLSIGVEIVWPMAVFCSAVALALWGVGRVVRSRTAMSRELRARTERLRAARDERARMEVAADRARLSRELDALLQRRLAALAQLAAAGRADDPDEARATFAGIERESRATLEEMRAAVGLLRSDEPRLVPQSALTGLEALLVQAKGADARLVVDGDPRVLPPVVELTAYRVVEQLLDALEDAPGVEVHVAFGDDALELTVAGPARRRARDSLDRARERTRESDGTFAATVRGGRAEAVVSLPVLAVV